MHKIQNLKFLLKCVILVFQYIVIPIKLVGFPYVKDYITKEQVLGNFLKIYFIHYLSFYIF